MTTTRKTVNDLVNEAMKKLAASTGLTTLAVKTRRPAAYVLHNTVDGTAWRGTAEGKWIAAPSGDVLELLDLNEAGEAAAAIGADAFAFLRGAEWARKKFGRASAAPVEAVRWEVNLPTLGWQITSGQEAAKDLLAQGWEIRALYVIAQPNKD